MSYGWGSTGENVTSERHTTWRQSDTRRDVRYVPRKTDMSHERHDFVTWLLHANAHPASRISQYDNSHPVRCFWILLEFRNTIVRVRSRVIRDMIIEKTRTILLLTRITSFHVYVLQRYDICIVRCDAQRWNSTNHAYVISL